MNTTLLLKVGQTLAKARVLSPALPLIPEHMRTVEQTAESPSPQEPRIDYQTWASSPV